MIDNDTLSDAEIVRLVGALDNRLGQMVQARLRRLRLVRVVSVEPAYFTGAVTDVQCHNMTRDEAMGGSPFDRPPSVPH